MRNLLCCTLGWLVLASLAVGQPVGRSFLSPEALVVDSELVVRGRLIPPETEPQGRSQSSWTEAKFEVEEYLKGSGPTVLTFSIRTYAGNARMRELANRPVLAFFKPSLSFQSRIASRHRYASRTGYLEESFVDLSPNARYELMGTDFKPISGPKELLDKVESAVRKTRNRTFRLTTIDIPPSAESKSKARREGELWVPEAISPDSLVRPEQALRLTPWAQFDGKRILAAHGRIARLWDAATGKLIQKFEGSTEDIQAVAFMPNHPSEPKVRVLSGSGLPTPAGLLGRSKDNGVRIWDVATGKVDVTLGPLRGPVVRVDALPNGRVITVSEEGYGYDGYRQRIWEYFRRTDVAVIPGYNCVFSPDGTMAASRTAPNEAFRPFAGVWDMDDFLQLCTLPRDRIYLSLNFSTFGNRLATASTDSAGNRLAEVWNAETGQRILELKGAEARIAWFTPDASMIVTAKHNGGIEVWDATTGGRIREIPLGVASRAILLSPDGTRVLAKWAKSSIAGGDEGAALLNLQTGKSLLDIQGNVDGLVGFSADGKTLFGFDSVEQRSGTIWNATTGRVVRKLSFKE